MTHKFWHSALHTTRALFCGVYNCHMSLKKASSNHFESQKIVIIAGILVLFFVLQSVTESVVLTVAILCIVGALVNCAIAKRSPISIGILLGITYACLGLVTFRLFLTSAGDVPSPLSLGVMPYMISTMATLGDSAPSHFSQEITQGITLLFSISAWGVLGGILGGAASFFVRKK